MLSDQACTQEKPATSPPSWDVGPDRSEGLNGHIEYKRPHTIRIISPPSMLKLRVFQQGLYGYVGGLSISHSSFFLVYEDEEVSRERLPWNVLSNSALSFAHGIASQDLDRPNTWRHHESETNVQTEDVLQTTHCVHSMTAHTRGILWKMIEPRSRSWLCCFRKQMLSNFVISKRCQRLSLPKRLTQRCLPRLQRVICLAPQSHLPTTGSETFPGTTSCQWTCFRWWWWWWWWCKTRNLMQSMDLDARFNGHGHGFVFSIPAAVKLFPPMRLQFLWKDGREILALKASLRISLVVVWNHLESTCNVSASNPQRLEQGARLGQLCRYNRERTKTRRSSRRSLCRKVCTWKTPGGRSSGSWWSGQPCVSALVWDTHACICKEPLRLSIWSGCENAQTSFAWSKISRSSLRDAMPECSRLNAWCCSGDPWSPSISRQWAIHTRLAAFNLRVAAVHFQMTDYSLEVKSRWARTNYSICLLTVWCVYPARECVVQAFQLANRHFMIGTCIVSSSILAYQVMNLCEADFAGGIRVNTFSTIPETSWNYDTVRGLNQGRMRWQASWMLQNSEPETFAAVCASKRAKQVTTQLLPKASSLIKQERSECSDDRCCDWCHSLPAFLAHQSEICVFWPQITTPAADHCKPWSLHVAPNQLEDKVPAIHLFFLIQRLLA